MSVSIVQLVVARKAVRLQELAEPRGVSAWSLARCRLVGAKAFRRSRPSVRLSTRPLQLSLRTFSRGELRHGLGKVSVEPSNYRLWGGDRSARCVWARSALLPLGHSLEVSRRLKGVNECVALNSA